MAQRGDALASLLAGSWRQAPPLSDGLSEEIVEDLRGLEDAGVVALVWWRLRGIEDASALREGARLLAVQHVRHEQQLRAVLAALREQGIESLLIKGWAVAHLYAEPSVRPLGDIDLVIHPGRRVEALAALGALDSEEFPIDLDHPEFSRLTLAGWDDLYRCSAVLSLEGEPVHALGPEDQLRFLCLHFLRDGAWRPLWLCDIAAALEARPQGFEWERCLGGDPVRRDWIECTLALAHRLLGADIAGTPIEAREGDLPAWFVRTVLREWDAPRNHRVGHFVDALRQPSFLLDAIRARWPNGIEASVAQELPLSRSTPVLSQLRTFISLSRLVTALRG